MATKLDLTTGIVFLKTGITQPVGSGTAVGTLGGTLFSSATATATTGTIEETLMQYTLPANTLVTNGRGIRITFGGISAANANTKTFKLYFGATVIANTSFTVAAPNGATVNAIVTLLRIGATTQIAGGLVNITGVGGFAFGAPAETLSGTVLIKLTGTTPTASGDLTANFIVIEAI
jgi:hypothetical protein